MEYEQVAELVIFVGIILLGLMAIVLPIVAHLEGTKRSERFHQHLRRTMADVVIQQMERRATTDKEDSR